QLRPRHLSSVALTSLQCHAVCRLPHSFPTRRSSDLWFVPLWNLLRKEMLQQSIVNADETRCHVLKEDGRESKQMSQMWVYCSPEKKIALYQYHPSRKGQVAKEMLGDFSGYLQTDGYSGYHCLDRVTHVGCWAHARRKWV